MPAATAEVAHATLAGCHRLRHRAQTCATRGSDPDGISDMDRPVFRCAFPPWFSDSDSETADAARGAATKSGGWRSSGTLSCQSKRMIDESVSARASLATRSTPTTCKLRGRSTSAAFCAAHETHWPASLMQRGREQPPGSAPTAVPRPARRVAHAPVPVSQTANENGE
jgi:hypothetical protein